MMSAIEVLDKPDKVDEIDLHNKVTGNHIKKKFLAELKDYQLIANIVMKDEHSRPSWLTAIVTDNFEEEIQSPAKFIKLQAVQTLIKEKTTTFVFEKAYAYEFDKARWVDGMLDYHKGEVLKYRTITEFVKKENIRAITLEEDCK